MDQQLNNQNSSPFQIKRPILPTWFVFVLLITTYPLGLLMMWLFTFWRKKTKLTITFGPILILIIISSIVVLSLSNENKKAKKQHGITQQKNITLDIQDNNRYVYTNTNIGYSISYPKNWRIEEDKYSDQYKKQMAYIFAPGYVSGTRGISITIDNYYNADYKNLDDYINSIKSYDINSPYYDSPKIKEKIKANQNLIINENTARQFVFLDGNIDTFIYGDQNIFTINFEILDENEDMDDHTRTYQDIIRTFKLH